MTHETNSICTGWKYSDILNVGAQKVPWKRMHLTGTVWWIEWSADFLPSFKRFQLSSWLIRPTFSFITHSHKQQTHIHTNNKHIFTQTTNTHSHKQQTHITKTHPHTHNKHICTQISTHPNKQMHIHTHNKQVKQRGFWGTDTKAGWKFAQKGSNRSTYLIYFHWVI